MDSSGHDWDFVISNHATASSQQTASENQSKMHSASQQGLQSQVCPDQSLLDTCKAVKDFFMLTAGCYTQEIAVHRTTLWSPHPRSNVQNTHTVDALLSIFSHGTTDVHMRHNLTLFARCIDVLGYAARTFALVSAASPHVLTLWSIRSTDVQYHQSLLGSTKEYVVERTEKSRSTPYPLSTPNTAVKVFVADPDQRSADQQLQQQPRPTTDSITYILSGAHQRQGDQARNAPARPSEKNQSFIEPHPLPPLRNPPVILPPLSEIETAAITAAQVPARIPGMHFQSNVVNYGLDIPDFSPHPSATVSIASEQLQVPAEQQQFVFKPPTPLNPLLSAPPSAASLYWPPRPPTSVPSLDVHSASAQLPLPSMGSGMNTLSIFGSPPMTNFTATSRPRRAGMESGSASQRTCSNCGRSNTRQWVRGEQNCWLCHSCGQFWRKNGYGRPASLWNRPTFKRSRRKSTTVARAPMHQIDHTQQQLPSPPVRSATVPGDFQRDLSAQTQILLPLDREMDPAVRQGSSAPLPATLVPQTTRPATSTGGDQYSTQGAGGLFQGQSGDPSLFRENM